LGNHKSFHEGGRFCSSAINEKREARDIARHFCPQATIACSAYTMLMIMRIMIHNAFGNSMENGRFQHSQREPTTSGVAGARRFRHLPLGL
jgi:hypothetical protein